VSRFRSLTTMMLIALGTTGCDQLSKSFVRAELKGGGCLQFFGGLFRVVHEHNSGSFLSLGSGLPEQMRFLLFTFGVSVVLTGLFVFLLVHTKPLSRWDIVSYGLIFGGGVGNLIDRVQNHGRVFDFMIIDFGFVSTGIFNVADFAVTVGVLLLILAESRWRRRESSQ
jgi:signal peptidase II